MPPARSIATPLVPVLAFTALASFATGTATLGIFFVTARPPYEFDAIGQYGLGLLVGVTYTAGALLASPLRAALLPRGLAARGLLAALSLAMAALMLVPVFARSAAVLFLLMAVYAPLTGCFWPLIEAFVSGGRRGAELRGAVGRFNIVWSATLLPSFLLPPLFADAARWVFLAVAFTHAASALLLLGFRAEPGEHEEEEAHAVPQSYGELLRVHRVLHATSYLVMYALSPYLPTVFAQLGLPARLHGVLAATWLGARTAAFALLERWHGWHGRWSVASGGIALVLGGFGATVLAPRAGAAALGLLLAGLVAFGVGLAALYTAALYYVFEVGGSEGGGSHEALIGLGYSVGPSCGLLVCGLERGGLFAEARREGALLLVISTLCVGAALWAWNHRRARAAARVP